MQLRILVIVSSIVLGLMLAGSPVSAGKFNKKLNVGDAAPVWKDLVGVDDKPHSLSDYEKAKVVVVAFTCNHCPVAEAYEDRFIAFMKAMKPQGVEFVAINCNLDEADLPEKMKERAQKKKFNYDYLFDATQEAGRAFGATVTPHLFVLDKDRRIAYMGAFDDNMKESEVKHHYLKDAVEALLAGKKPEVEESRQFGCSIGYQEAKK